MAQEKKYFGTDGIRGRVGEFPVHPEFALKLGWAVGNILAREGGGDVIIGKDTRVSGYMLESALQAGLSAAGLNVKLLGPMPTPAIAYLTTVLNARAGVVISASHNPYYDNGIKLFSAQGSKLPDEIELKIEEQLALPMVLVDSSKLGKVSRVVDAASQYIEFCKNTFPADVGLRQMKIIVDCANGATYHIAPAVFRALGAQVIELGIQPNGFNINKDCGSTCVGPLQKAVVAESADVGIAFDGDGDRVIMVDHRGEMVDGDELLFIIAKYYQQQGILNGGVIGTIMSNLGLEIALREENIAFARAKVGDRYVLEELKKRGWYLGGESSGHIIWLKATTTGDGIISALQILAAQKAADCSLHELKAGLVKFPQAMINVKTQKGRVLLTDPKLQAAIQEVERQLADRGRVLLRPSGTEPLLRIMVEGQDRAQVDKFTKQLAQLAEQIESGL